MEFRASTVSCRRSLIALARSTVHFHGIGGQVDDCGKQGGADEAKGCVLIRGCGGHGLGDGVGGFEGFGGVDFVGGDGGADGFRAGDSVGSGFG